MLGFLSVVKISRINHPSSNGRGIWSATGRSSRKDLCLPFDPPPTNYNINYYQGKYTIDYENPCHLPYDEIYGSTNAMKYNQDNKSDHRYQIFKIFYGKIEILHLNI